MHRTTSLQTVQSCVNYCGGLGNGWFHFDTSTRECACFNGACSSMSSAATYTYGSIEQPPAPTRSPTAFGETLTPTLAPTRAVRVR